MINWKTCYLKNHFYRITEQRSMCLSYGNLMHKKLGETFFLQHLLKDPYVRRIDIDSVETMQWLPSHGQTKVLSRKPRDWASLLHDGGNVVNKSANSGLHSQVSNNKTRKRQLHKKLRQAIFLQEHATTIKKCYFGK